VTVHATTWSSSASTSSADEVFDHDVVSGRRQ